MNKKRYAGLYWTKPSHYDKMDTKGIEVGSINQLQAASVRVRLVLMGGAMLG